MAEGIFISSVDTEQFKAMSSQIDGWIVKPDNDEQAKFCETLKEFVELKKLNANLVKLPVIDELIADTYAEIWAHRTPASQHPEELVRTIEADGSGTLRSAATGPSAEEKGHRAMSFHNMLKLDGTIDKVPSLVRQATPTRNLVSAVDGTGQPQPPQSYTPEKRPRMVSRPMIIKRAQETILSKPAPKAPSPVRQASPNAISASVAVVIDTPAPTQTPGEARPES